MQYSCYRCGAAVEEQTPFCASCGAPQIRVNIAQEVSLTSDTPVTPPLEPGTPASIQPPAMPVHFDGRTIVPRKRFLRQIWPFALASGIMLERFFPVGLVLLLGSVIYCISRYRRNQPGSFSRADGARLGVLTALLSFLPFVLLLAWDFTSDPDISRELRRSLQQHAAQGPQYQQMLQWASTQEGLLALTIMSIGFFLLLLLAFAAITGAIAARPESDQRQP